MIKLQNILKKSAKIFGHVLMPDTCLHCGIDMNLDRKIPLCLKCETGLEIMPELQCERCGVVMPYGGAYCHRCRGYKAANYKCSLVRSALIFNSQIRSVIHHFKYRQKTKLASYLGKFLNDAFGRYTKLHDSDIIVPVAISPKKLKTRGFNQATLLAGGLAGKVGLKFSSGILARVKYAKSQTELSRTQRTENVKDAFCITFPGEVKGKNVLLIDDVATTTATLEACAVALKKSKAKKVRALTIARE
jgi:ComF family protein